MTPKTLTLAALTGPNAHAGEKMADAATAAVCMMYSTQYYSEFPNGKEKDATIFFVAPDFKHEGALP